MSKNFSENIIHWYQLNKRNLPWRNYQHPYPIWLSEILLQQTRVDQGKPYFIKFIERFPTIEDLASADIDEILKMWQGLGYYSRARNMHSAAKTIVENYNSIFPDNWKDMVALKGVGDYTAAAVLSIAYNKAHAVLDGNVYRVLARYFGIDKAIDSPNGKKYFTNLANELIDQDDPGTYNQAIMEFGSLQCSPKKPKCPVCPVQNSCFAFQNDKINDLPFKSKKTLVKSVYYHFFYLSDSNVILLEQRPDKGIWNSMYQFPMVEVAEDTLIEKKFIALIEEKGLRIRNGRLLNKTEMTHQLSHRKIYATFWHFEADSVKIHPNSAIFECKSNRLKKQYAVPRLIELFIENLGKELYVNQ